ncbi:MAG: LysR family transcriptional regulator [Spirochaetales bacterium]|nr:LysR family transcriptional regulator [Spirochaetales bacterium]
MIERIHLEILAALDDLGSLTAASEKLCLTQSALTHSIKKLENETGCRIWDKRGRKLELTQAGAYLLETAVRMLPLFEDSEETLKLYARGKKGKLRIGVECHPCFEWLVGMVREFLHKWPDVDIDVTRSFQFDGLQALEERKVDMVVSPDYIKRNGIYYRPIRNFELKLMLHREHRLADRIFIDPDALKNETLFTYPISRERLDIFTAFLKPAGIEPQIHESIETAEIMLQLVSANRGVSSFPDWLIERYALHNPVKGVSLGKKGIRKKLYILVREEDRGVPYIRDFLG